jgi:hypothetical protein
MILMPGTVPLRHISTPARMTEVLRTLCSLDIPDSLLKVCLLAALSVSGSSLRNSMRDALQLIFGTCKSCPGTMCIHEGQWVWFQSSLILRHTAVFSRLNLGQSMHSPSEEGNGHSAREDRHGSFISADILRRRLCTEARWPFDCV